MPISRTVSGIIYRDDFESIDGWYNDYNVPPGGGSYCWDYGGVVAHGITTGRVGNGAYTYENSQYGTWNPYCSLVKTIPTGSGSAKLRIWHKWAWADGGGGGGHDSYARAFRVISTLQGTPAEYYSTGVDQTHDWALEKLTLTCTGNQLVQIAFGLAGKGGYGTYDQVTCYVDDLCITPSDNVIVAGLIPGQKVEIYRTDTSALVGSATCAAGATGVTIDISSSDYPQQMYVKVYAADSVTLLDTTSSTEIVGGDTWEWYPPGGTLSMSLDVAIIYRSAATGTPKTCNVTANLKTPAGANYAGATIHFTTTRGTVSPASDVTDANGNAETALTSTTHGIAVVKAVWLGDATVPACSAYIVVHVFYEAEAGDSSKKFQFFCEGIEYAYVGGRYSINEIGAPNNFEVEIPEWVSTITPNGFVDIYRLGVKEFHGILKRIKRGLSDSPRVSLSGPDVSILLKDSVIDTKIYAAKTPQYIIDDLLTSFPCGITAGSLGANATSLTITLDTETLDKAIPRICDMVGWKYRVTLTRTLDFAESFSGGTSSAAFTEGVDIFSIDRDIDYNPVANYIRMRGTAPASSSTKLDGAKIQEQGLHQAAAFNKSIVNQTTLDAACQAYLDMRKAEQETTPFEAKDSYTPGTFGPEDYITITSATVGMSGTYQIRKIERDLADPYLAKFDLVNRTKEYWELDQQYRRMTKDASV